MEPDQDNQAQLKHFTVRLFQTSRINTEMFNVEAVNEDEACQKVLNDDTMLKSKDDAKTDGKFDIEVTEDEQPLTPAL